MDVRTIALLGGNRLLAALLCEPRAHLPGEPADIMAVVKADAYGHGVELVGPRRCHRGCPRAFGVATVVRRGAGFKAALPGAEARRAYR